MNSILVLIIVSFLTGLTVAAPAKATVTATMLTILLPYNTPTDITTVITTMPIIPVISSSLDGMALTETVTVTAASSTTAPPHSSTPPAETVTVTVASSTTAPPPSSTAPAETVTVTVAPPTTATPHSSTASSKTVTVSVASPTTTPPQSSTAPSKTTMVTTASSTTASPTHSSTTPANTTGAAHPDACSSGTTHRFVRAVPWGQVGFHYQNATASSGYFCCTLCHYSMKDCVLASWDLSTQYCSMMIHHGSEGVAERQKTEVCPHGHMESGEMLMEDVLGGNWEQGLIQGPCF
ncbi:MAG: hypothetical protein Q9191_000739 [Dirinaria sp. TL-2023a]